MKILLLLLLVVTSRKYSTYQFIKSSLQDETQEIKQSYIHELGQQVQAFYDIFFRPEKVRKQVIPEIKLSREETQPEEPLFVDVKNSNFYNKPQSTRALGEQEMRRLNQCVNGISHTSDITIYFCHDERVTKTEYDSQTSTDPSQCSTQIQASQNLCICARDYHGMLCDEQVPVYCYPELVWPDVSKCRENKEDTQFYSYSIPGDDPCIFVKEDETQILRFKTVCTSPYWAKEEIDTEDMFTVNNPPSGPYAFTYFINNTDLVMSQLVETQVQLLRFDFAAFVWEEMVHSLTTPAQFTGHTTFEFTLHMPTEKQKKHITGGRLYFEVFHRGTPTGAVVTQVQPGFIDILGYDPGTKNYNSLSGGVIAAIVLAVVVLVAVIVIVVVCCCIKKKRKRVKTHAD